MISGVEIESNKQRMSVEWVLIALISVFVLGGSISILLSFSVVMGFWLGGVLVLGGMPFVVLHRLGLRQWYGMTLVGSVVMLLIGLFVLGGISEPEIALVMAAIGSAIGWIIWRVAYRRIPLER